MKFFNESEIQKTPTHYLFNGYAGGKVYIPNEYLHEFLIKYANELEKKNKLYFIENRSEIYKFMIDLDIKDKHYKTKEEIIEIVKTIQKTIKLFFTSEKYVICCISPQKVSKDIVHTGIHLIWPSIFVGDNLALFLRGEIVKSLSLTFKDDNWEEVVDKKIYISVGYRMIGSDKCDPKDKTPKNRELELYFVMDSDYILSEKYFERLINNKIDLVMETSIRNVPETYSEQEMIVDSLPEWIKDVPDIRRKNISSCISVPRSDPIYNLIQNFFKLKLPSVYHNCIKEIRKYQKIEDFPEAMLITTNSRYCMNIGKEHNSCGVYFYVTKAGITQRCLCTCDKLCDRKNGLCKNYISGLYKFSSSLSEKIFGIEQIDPEEKLKEELKEQKLKEEKLKEELKEQKLKEEKLKEELKQQKKDQKEKQKQLREQKQKEKERKLKLKEEKVKLEINSPFINRSLF